MSSELLSIIVASLLVKEAEMQVGGEDKNARRGFVQFLLPASVNAFKEDLVHHAILAQCVTLQWIFQGFVPKA